MKKLLLIAAVFLPLFCTLTLYAQTQDTAKTYLQNIVQCLQQKDYECFANQFPSSLQYLRYISIFNKTKLTEEQKASVEQLLPVLVKQSYDTAVTLERTGFKWKDVEYKEAVLKEDTDEDRSGHSFKVYHGTVLLHDKNQHKDYMAAFTELILIDGKLYSINVTEAADADTAKAYLHSKGE